MGSYRELLHRRVASSTSNGEESMRIGLAGFSHETNTFSNVPATYDRFTIDRGEEIVRRHTGANSTVTGFLEVAAERGVELVPLLKAQTGPIGMISADAF